MSKNIVIDVKNVSKDFKLPHQKAGSVKNIFTRVFSKRNREYEIQNALQDINFQVKKGEFFGIVGRNGSGKSTLLKILADIYQPTRGIVTAEGRIVPFIELGVGFNGELTGRENVYLNGALLGFNEEEINKKYDDIVGFAELEKFMDQKLKNYSSGMQVRLAFSVATKLAESDILLIDEVLAVGDANFQRKCLDYFRELKRMKKTVVFVSHDMASVERYCDRAMLINESKVVKIGPSGAIGSMYSKMFTDELLEKQEKKRQKTNLSPSGEERWGDSMAKINMVEAKVDASEAGNITVAAEIEFLEDMAKPIFGFSIKNGSFTQLIGTNTDRKKIKLPAKKKGEKSSIEWTVPNIFNDGLHYVDCTIAHDEAVNVSDRWPEATSFRVVRKETNPYLIYSPTINFEINTIKGRK